MQMVNIGGKDFFAEFDRDENDKAILSLTSMCNQKNKEECDGNCDMETIDILESNY